MRIEVSKGAFLGILLLGLLLIGLAGGFAFTSNGVGGNPLFFGHSVNEMDWSKNFSMINVSKVCIGGDCRTGWPSGAITQIIAGRGITISGGTGVVTINATVTGSQWITSGNNLYNNNSGYVGIGTANPHANLEVAGDIKATRLCTGNSACISNFNYRLVYKNDNYCGDANGVTISSSCQTRTCPYGVSWRYYDCGGNCDENSAKTCSNSVLGYLVN